MLHFCTLFNSTYLTRGVAMYNSLFNYCKEFQLFIFAMDEDCYNALRKLGLKNVKVIELSSFENKDLLIVKSQRTAREYLWTCASAVSYTHLRAHETGRNLVCRLLLEKK